MAASGKALMPDRLQPGDLAWILSGPVHYSAKFVEVAYKTSQGRWVVCAPGRKLHWGVSGSCLAKIPAEVAAAWRLTGVMPARPAPGVKQ